MMQITVHLVKKQENCPYDAIDGFHVTGTQL